MNKIFLFLILLISFSAAVAQTDIASIQAARNFSNNKEWDKAIDAWKSIIEKDKYNGDFYASLAEAYYNNKNYSESIRYYKEAINIGYVSGSCAYNIACCYALMGDADSAIQWLNTAAEYKYRNLEESMGKDGDFDKIRSTEKFKAMVTPDKFSANEKAEQWKADISYLKKRMEETHYNVYDVQPKEQWDARFAALLDNVDGMDDEHVMTEIAKILASVGDGHTILFPIGKMGAKFEIYPVQFYKFKDGFYIKGIAADYSQYAGMKVTKIGKMKTDDALKKIAEVVPYDNEFGLDWQIPKYLTYNFCLYGLGINDSKDVLKLELEDESGKKTNAEIKKIAVDFMSTFHTKGKDGFVYANDKSVGALPLYLKNPGDNYWFELLPDINYVYMQVNAIESKKDESMKKFYDRVFRFIDSNKVEGIIIDLRLNSGGNNQLNKYLINNFIKNDGINKRGKIFTIIGRNTFSAAMNLAADLETNTQTIFIGEPTGSRPNFIGEINFIDLPYSGFKVSASSLYWQKAFSSDKRKWISPEVYAPLNFSDYKNNVDPAMNAVYDYINYMKKSQ